MTPSPLLTRAEAAAFLRVSLTTFKTLQAQLAPYVIRIGTRVLYDTKDLQRWVDEQKGSKSAGETPSPMSVSATKASVMSRPSAGTLSPRGRAIRDQLKRRPHSDTPRLFPVGGAPPRQG